MPQAEQHARQVEQHAARVEQHAARVEQHAARVESRNWIYWDEAAVGVRFDEFECFAAAD